MLDGATPDTDRINLENPDYWQGRWYEDIKSVVQMVATEMRNHGVDPTLISPEDAWAHYRARIVDGHKRLEARGLEVPQIYREYAQPNSAASTVFLAMWRLLDLHKLLKA
jgi:hypothetical protein